VHPPPRTEPSTGLGADELTDALVNTYKADYIILAGYMKLVPATLVRAYHQAILNIHPGLLPSFGGRGFYGSRVHQGVIQSGARFSGPTVHFVDEEYDTGPILAQAVVPVLPTDSVDGLAARVLKEEHRLYPKCVAALCEGRITWRHDGIPIMWSAH
jgi:phosphoribosylglycinamide formyltransferase